MKPLLAGFATRISTLVTEAVSNAASSHVAALGAFAATQRIWRAAPRAVPDPRSAQRDPLIGARLGRHYRVERCIGAGGMARVYRALHVPSKRAVAIKVLRERFAGDAELEARFRLEAQVLLGLSSPHVVRALDVGQLPNGADYLVVELLCGADLGQTVKREGPLSLERALAITHQLCEAVASVHALGIVHRDLKPENVFLARDGVGDARVKLLDFGVCRIRQGGSARALTRAGSLLGTPHYMAPEQIEDVSSVDPRSDVYALGAVIYFMLTGRPPFDDENLLRLLLRISEDAPPSLCITRPDLPPALDHELQRALSKRPTQRHVDALTLSAALDRATARAE